MYQKILIIFWCKVSNGHTKLKLYTYMYVYSIIIYFTPTMTCKDYKCSRSRFVFPSPDPKKLAKIWIFPQINIFGKKYGFFFSHVLFGSGMVWDITKSIRGSLFFLHVLVIFSLFIFNLYINLCTPKTFFCYLSGIS